MRLQAYSEQEEGNIPFQILEGQDSDALFFIIQHDQPNKLFKQESHVFEKNYILHTIKCELALVSCRGSRQERDGCLYIYIWLLLYRLTTSRIVGDKLIIPQSPQDLKHLNYILAIQFSVISVNYC